MKTIYNNWHIDLINQEDNTIDAIITSIGIENQESYACTFLNQTLTQEALISKCKTYIDENFNS